MDPGVSRGSGRGLEGAPVASSRAQGLLARRALTGVVRPPPPGGAPFGLHCREVERRDPEDLLRWLDQIPQQDGQRRVAERGRSRHGPEPIRNRRVRPVERRAERTAIIWTMRVRPGLMSQGARVNAALARQRPRPSVRSPPHSPEPNVASDDVRTPLEPGLCAVCGPLTGRRPQRVCSPRCRVAYWRALRAQETATTLVQLLAENAALRQRVTELANLVG